jgi:hypothetical protein
MIQDPTNLSRLHDIVVPAPAPWWPPAPGWWWLLGAAAVAALVTSVCGFCRWQQNRYRREACAELTRLLPAAASAEGRAAALAAIAVLLKRTALTAFPRAEVASLTGAEWDRFLDREGGTRFATGLGRRLQAAVHDPRTADDWDRAGVEALAAMARRWIRRHDAGGRC